MDAFFCGRELLEVAVFFAVVFFAAVFFAPALEPLLTFFAAVPVRPPDRPEREALFFAVPALFAEPAVFFPALAVVFLFAVPLRRLAVFEAALFALPPRLRELRDVAFLPDDRLAPAALSELMSLLKLLLWPPAVSSS